MISPLLFRHRTAGTQHEYDKYFKGRLEKTEVGYTVRLLSARTSLVNHSAECFCACSPQGGKVDSPSYRQVCSGTTAHAEACRIQFDPAKVSYAELIEFFFRTHDPTQLNGAPT